MEDALWGGGGGGGGGGALCGGMLYCQGLVDLILVFPTNLVFITR